MEKGKKFIGCWNKSVIITYLGIIVSIIGTTELILNNNCLFLLSISGKM